MRTPALLLAALLIVTVIPAQTGMDVTSVHQVRIAYGDIPATSDQSEDPGRWNVEQKLVLAEGGNGTVSVPNSHVLGAIRCSDGCDFDVTAITAGEVNTAIQVTCNTTTDAGTCDISIPHSVGGQLDAFGMSLPVAADHTAFVYLPEGLAIQSSTEDALADAQPFYYPGTNLVIHQFTSDGERFWFTVSPQAVTTAPAVDGTTILWAGLSGLVTGIVLWYILVAQGVVQKRQRKQVAGEAAHKTAAKSADKATLEWRRRALLAALKELEVARMDQTIDLDAYDALKADFKRQTVTVMRALEELPE